MKLDESSEMNIDVLKFLSRSKKKQSPIALPNTVQDPYYQQGSHPDVVERIWDQIGSSLPTDCRCLVYGSPALVHPKSGIVFVFSSGTVYYLRLNAKLMDEAMKVGAKRYIKWTGGGDMNTQQEFGPDWILGGWFVDEIRWCRAVFEELREIRTS